MVPSAAEVADAWIAKWASAKPEGSTGPYDLDFDVPRNHPELCLLAVIKALEMISPGDDRLVSVLAAGPLEDLLKEHGPDVVSQVVQEASRNPAFASLLGGVWKSSIDDAVWLRVQKVCDRRRWGENAL